MDLLAPTFKLNRLSRRFVVGFFSLFFSLAASATVISAGSATHAVPPSLDDPFGTLGSPLPAGYLLLPIEVSEASDLQDWSFDLLFDGNVVAPADLGGVYQWLYRSLFNDSDATLSEFTSSGQLVAGALEGIAGFSSGVDGDGLLGYGLFRYLDGQEDKDPHFRIDDRGSQAMPEPSSISIVLLALAGGLLAARTRGPLSFKRSV